MSFRHRPSHSLPARRPVCGRAWLAWLCLALLLATQGLGQVHRIAHAHASGAAWHQASTQAVAGVGDSGSDDWGHASGSADCQLYDQLGHIDGLPIFVLPPCAALPTAPAAGPLAVSARLSERWTRGARAPPPSLLG